MGGLIIVLLSGALIMDVALDLWRTVDGVGRQRRRDRDRAEMLRTLDRTGGRRD